MSVRRGRWILLGLLGFGLVLLGPLLSSHEGPYFAGIPGIENKIESSAADLLDAEGVAFDSIDADGRDLSVTTIGGVPDGLAGRLGDLDLVRNVTLNSGIADGGSNGGAGDTSGSEPSATDVSVGGGDVSVLYDGQQVQLSGQVLSEQGRESLRANAERIVGADNVTGDIGVLDEPGDDLERLSAVAAIVGRLDDWFSSAELSLSGDQLDVTGTVQSDAQQGQAEQIIAQLAQSVGIESSFNLLVDPSAPSPVDPGATPEPQPEPTVAPTPTPEPEPTATPVPEPADTEPTATPVPEPADAEPDAAAAVGALDLAGVTFEVGTDALTAEATTVLDGVAEQLRGLDGVAIEIQGHTDDSGDPDVNLLLSQLRAEAVRNYLVNGGVSADTLTARGYGSSQPVADNSTEAGQAANRRVELVVVEGNN